MTVPERTPSDYFHCGAGDWNAFARAANAHLAGEGMVTPPPVPALRNASIVYVENTTASDVGRFGVLGIDGVTITPTDNADEFKARPCVEGYTPSEGDHEGKFVVTIEPIAAGEFGKAVVAGLAVCQVVVTDTDHRFATLIDASTAGLTSAAVGSAQILWAETGTGIKWALVRLGNATPATAFYGQATADWTNVADNGSYVDVNPSDDLAGTTIDTGTTHRVYLPRPYDGSSVAAADPNVREDQIIAYVLGPDGEYVAVSGYLDAPIGAVRMWTDATNIPPGWAIADGTGGTRDLRGKFVVGYHAGGDGDGHYAAVGTPDTPGGFKWHGTTENNHPKHDLDHTHPTGACVDTAASNDVGTGQYVVTVSDPTGGPTWTGSTSLPTQETPDGSDLADHKGPYNTNADTDNRPPYYVVVFIERMD